MKGIVLAGGSGTRLYPITKGVSKKEAVRAAEEDKKATVFGYWVSDPERYGVAEPTPNREQYQACA